MEDASGWPSAMRIGFSMSWPGWTPVVIQALILTNLLTTCMCKGNGRQLSKS